MGRVYTEGQKINQFTLVKHIGSGGSADVWACVDEKGKQWAIKILELESSSNLPGNNLLKKEFENTKYIKHKNILTPKELGEFNGTYYLISEYCDKSLMDELKIRFESSKSTNQMLFFSEVEIAKLIYDISSGLAFLHAEGFIHGDIKPDNILQKKTRGKISYLLSDFGISTQNRKTLIGEEMGSHELLLTGISVAYAAPEQFCGRIYEESDIFSFGVTLYELIAGQLPNENSRINIGQVILHGGEVSDFDFDYSIRFQSILKQMLAKERNDRPSAALLQSLSEFFLKNGFWENIPLVDSKQAIFHNTNPNPNHQLKLVASDSKSINKFQNQNSAFWRTMSISFGAIILLFLGYFIIDIYGDNINQEAAFKLFEEGKYTEASKEFKKLRVKDPSNPSYQKYNRVLGKILSFDDVRIFQHNVAAVSKNGKWSYINQDGDLIAPLEFDKVIDFYGQYGIVQKGTNEPKCGVINQFGELPLQLKYSNCTFIDSNTVEIISKKTNSTIKKDTVHLNQLK